MIRRRPNRRPAATLLEVLIGFGIMGVAVTSIISLFPFAALTIAKALRDDRGTTCAISGDGLMRDVHKRYVVEAGDSTNTEPYHWAMDNPAGSSTTPAVPATALSGYTQVSGLTAVPTTATTPSYPVYVDPMGWAANASAVGDAGAAKIPRATFQFILAQPSSAQNPLALRVASQLDGLNFSNDGTVPGGFDMRELRYNMAWMLQRPSNRDRFTVRQQVIVYDRRAHLYRPPGSEVVFSNITMDPGSGTPNTTISGVPNTAEIRKGTWILDAGDQSGSLNGGSSILQAEFYRVVSVTDTGTSYTLEVHKPIVRFDGQTAPYSANLVVIPAISDVFERPPLTAGTGP